MMHWHGGGHGRGRLGSSLDEWEEEEYGKVYDQGVVVRLLGYLRPYRRLTALSFFAMLLYTGTSVAGPWLIKTAIDGLLERQGVGHLTWVVLLFGLNALMNFATQYIHLVALARVSQGVLFDLRAAMFAHLQRLSVSFYDRNEAGRIMSRVQNDVTQLQEFLSIIVLSLGDLLSLVGIVVVLFLMHGKLALVTLAVIPVLFAVLALWQGAAKRSFMRVRRAISVVNAGLQENISGVRVVQSMNRQSVNLQAFDRVNAEHLDANIHAGRLTAAVLPVVEVLTAVSIALVVIYGGSLVLQGQLAVGALVAFVLYIQRFFDPIRNLTMQYTQLQRAMASGQRIFELLDTKSELEDAPKATPLPPIRGDIRLEGVRFHYTPEVEVLRGIDLHIRAGETVALVGATGAGKSTLVALLARFYDVTGGRILVDGHDLRQVTRGSLARQMAMVLQEPFLFSGTVKENIKYHRVEAPDQAVEEAARAVGAHEFIMKLPHGYDAVLQERGQNLSIGQRQLLSFARALLADPRILILDEATANIDSYTEMLIQRALERILRGRTAIIIAHRLSTVRIAHRIVALDAGRIVEEGTHQELLTRGGPYAKLYTTYFAAEAAAPARG